jgi:hypothetical protein
VSVWAVLGIAAIALVVATVVVAVTLAMALPKMLNELEWMDSQDY